MIAYVGVDVNADPPRVVWQCTECGFFQYSAMPDEWNRLGGIPDSTEYPPTERAQHWTICPSLGRSNSRILFF